MPAGVIHAQAMTQASDQPPLATHLLRTAPGYLFGARWLLPRRSCQSVPRLAVESLLPPVRHVEGEYPPRKDRPGQGRYAPPTHHLPRLLCMVLDYCPPTMCASHYR
jgi:hypothetical protein